MFCMCRIYRKFISVRRLTKMGYLVIFKIDECNIVRAHEGIPVAFDQPCRNLYKLKTPNILCVIVNLDSESTKNCIHKWHSVLGHRDSGHEIQVSDLVNGIHFGKCNKE